MGRRQAKEMSAKGTFSTGVKMGTFPTLTHQVYFPFTFFCPGPPRQQLWQWAPGAICLGRLCQLPCGLG